MNDRCRYELTSYLNEIKAQYATQSSRLQQLDRYVSRRLKVNKAKNGRQYYYVFDEKENRFRYLGKKDNEDVCKILEAHYLQLSTRELQHEIAVVERALRFSRNIDYDSINKLLSNTYRNSPLTGFSVTSNIAKEWKLSMETYKQSFPTFRPEELIHRTRDGTMVRSLGEALIYNYLLDIGVAFVYELPLRIRFGGKDCLLLPDFTILSEIDYKTVIYLEHQGMMNDPKYRNKFNEKVYKYWLNDYIPERDVFFTFDLPNGGFDDRPIKSIISRYIRPQISIENIL
ncbi:MAG: hypothetical protein IJH92_09565 [Mogibacterium sp.]|nr:hypothetical protein [Mogibacterium sp.]MBR0469169.1 hypothetical protein [Mogibacterium sp.]